MTQPITLALGGGGARGAAHLGVIEAFEHAKIPIARIVGTSIGSIMGAAYAAEPDIETIQRRMLAYVLSEAFQKHQHAMFGTRSAEDGESGGMFRWYGRVKDYLRANRIFHRVITQPSMLPGVVLQDVVNHLIPDMDISETQVPLSVVALDLCSGHRVVLEKGSLQLAARASSALPGIFPPIEWDRMLLCDIGVFNSLPSIVAKAYGAPLVVAVDVSTDVEPQDKFENALDVIMRVDEVGEALYRRQIRNVADIVIRPPVAGIEWFDFSNSDKLIQAGRTAGRSGVKKLQALLKKRRL